MSMTPFINRPDPPRWVYFLMALSIAVLIAMMLSSCYTANKASQQVGKAIEHYPEQVAKQTRDRFPCVTTRRDSLITVTDTVVYIQCPETPEVTPADYSKDTVVVTKIIPGQTVTKLVRVPVTLPMRTITVTLKEKDSAEVFIAQAETRRAMDKLAKTEKKLEQAEYWDRFWKKVALICILIIGVTIMFKIWKIKIPFL